MTDLALNRGLPNSFTSPLPYTCDHAQADRGLQEPTVYRWVKPATMNRELATLKNACNLARREWEWCTDYPVCRVSMEKGNNWRDRWLTVEEE